MTLHRPPTTPSPPRPRATQPGERFGFLFDFPSHARWRPATRYRAPGGPPPADPDAELRAAAARWNARLFQAPTVEGTLPAATTFLGQFIAHDLSFDARSLPRSPREPVTNHRTPSFDLDSLYGGGPIAAPQFYQAADRRLFALGSNGGSPASSVPGALPSRPEPDLLRSAEASADWALTSAMSRRRTAILPDPRNDENVILSQLHLAFQRFHNRIVHETNCSFEVARQAVRHAYHQIVVKDFLIPLCGPGIVGGLLRSGPGSAFRHFRRRRFVPYEFALALFRFGHSMIGEAYHLNDRLEQERGGRPIRFTREELARDRDRDRFAHAHLDGGRILPPRWTVQWDRFVATPSSTARLQRAQAIDLRIAPPLSGLPIAELPPAALAPIERSLPYRTLLRGSKIGLPTGAWVAERVVGARGVLQGLDPHEPDPLWIYVLHEAEAQPVAGGQLGPVAARLVAEVCVGLLFNDPAHGLAAAAPVPVISLGRNPGLLELLEFAGMPITRADWDRAVLGGSSA